MSVLELYIVHGAHYGYSPPMRELKDQIPGRLQWVQLCEQETVVTGGVAPSPSENLPFSRERC